MKKPRPALPGAKFLRSPSQHEPRRGPTVALAAAFLAAMAAAVPLVQSRALALPAVDATAAPTLPPQSAHPIPARLDETPAFAGG